MLRILIADDHTLIRQGLERLLRKEFPSALIDEVADTEDMIKKVINAEWDLVISDLAMPGRTGLEALVEIRKLHPKLPVLILSMHSEEEYALRAIKAGASGYLSKNVLVDELIAATRRVLLGRRYITPAVAEKLSDQYSGKRPQWSHESLSDREFETLKLLAMGKSPKEIGKIMSISAITVSTYRTRILTKMQLKTNADLTKYAILNKLTDDF